jgi:hypothetical protein
MSVAEEVRKGEKSDERGREGEGARRREIERRERGENEEMRKSGGREETETWSKGGGKDKYNGQGNGRNLRREKTRNEGGESREGSSVVEKAALFNHKHEFRPRAPTYLKACIVKYTRALRRQLVPRELATTQRMNRRRRGIEGEPRASTRRRRRSPLPASAESGRDGSSMRCP